MFFQLEKSADILFSLELFRLLGVFFSFASFNSFLLFLLVFLLYFFSDSWALVSFSFVPLLPKWGSCFSFEDFSADFFSLFSSLFSSTIFWWSFSIRSGDVLFSSFSFVESASGSEVLLVLIFLLFSSFSLQLKIINFYLNENILWIYENIV